MKLGITMLAMPTRPSAGAGAAARPLGRGGRAGLGVGPGALPQPDTAPTKALSRVSEYLDVLRLSWQCLRTGEARVPRGVPHVRAAAVQPVGGCGARRARDA